ncbi:hypothetical protein ACV56Z_10840 [Staphylococcus aureus]
MCSILGWRSNGWCDRFNDTIYSHWERPEHIQSLTLHSAFETLQQHLPEMKRHADIIVVCYHGGFEKDLKWYADRSING